MKYSLIISPLSKNSIAAQQCLQFATALFELNHEIVSVFFDGYAVKYAFESSPEWSKLSKKSVKLLACSTIADDYLSEKKQVAEGFQLAGLGQWLESIESSDKMIEFS